MYNADCFDYNVYNLITSEVEKNIIANNTEFNSIPKYGMNTIEIPHRRIITVFSPSYW